jgi:integrase
MPKIQLTPQFIKTTLTCPAGKNRIEYCDIAFPGLYVEVRSTSEGKGTYYLRYKNSHSKTCHQKLGRTYELTLGEARKRAKTLKAEILLGADPRGDAKKQREVILFDRFIHDHYLPYIKVSKRSWQNDESMLRLRMLDVFGSYPLNAITRRQIQSFHIALKESGLSGSSCDHHIKVIRYALNLAIEWELLDKNPADKIQLFKEDNRKERYMTHDELDRLLIVLKEYRNQTIARLVMFLLSTGARLNEALKAKWTDIDIDTKTWRIPATNSKSKKIQSKPLNTKAVELLAQLQEDNISEYLFINVRTGNPYVNVNKPWRDIRVAAGLPELRLHDLRHQYASMLVNSGRSLYEVQQLLGHSDPSVTQRYAHLSTKTLQEASESAALPLTQP